MSKDAITLLIKRLNEAWLQGRMDDLYDIFHRDVVALPPGGLVREREHQRSRTRGVSD